MKKTSKVSQYWKSRATFINQNLGAGVQPISPQELREMHCRSIKRGINHRKLNPELYEKPTR
jgi:ribosomal protein L16 Arg81 hydroxylase